MKKLFTSAVAKTALLALTALCMLGSCSKDDGDWESMKWKSESFVDKNHQIEVPAEGGTYILTCTNYDPWVEMIQIGDKAYSQMYNDSPVLSADWLSARADEVGKVKIEVAPNESGEWRRARVYVTAGDIFDHFIVMQDTK